MPSIEQLVSEIENIRVAMSQNEESFNKLLERYVYLQDFKIALIEETEERHAKYHEILEEREKHRQQRYESGFGPIQEPIYEGCNQLGDPRYSKGFTCCWDPWLGVYLPNHYLDDMNMNCPSRLEFDLGDEPLKRHIDLLNEMKQYFDDIKMSHNINDNSNSSYDVHQNSSSTDDARYNIVDGEIIDLTIDENDDQWFQSQYSEVLDLRTNTGKN